MFTLLKKSKTYPDVIEESTKSQQIHSIKRDSKWCKQRRNIIEDHVPVSFFCVCCTKIISGYKHKCMIVLVKRCVRLCTKMF